MVAWVAGFVREYFHKQITAMFNLKQKTPPLAAQLAVMTIILAILAAAGIILAAGPQATNVPVIVIVAVLAVIAASLLSYAISRAHTAHLTTTITSLMTACDDAIFTSQLKSQILATVSHDLRTPLSSILSYAEIMLQGMNGPVTDQQKETLNRLANNAEQLLAFVNKLLDSAQIDAGKVNLEIAAFPPSELLFSIDTMVNGQASRKGLSLITEIDEGVPEEVVGDLARMEQIVSNLVGNAVKFTEEGTVKVRVYCPDDDHWAVDVSDTGPGISKEAQENIFDAFWQLDGPDNRTRDKGSGLGLYIVKQMTNLMNGEVSLVSEVGQGSTFTVTVPMMRPEETSS